MKLQTIIRAWALARDKSIDYWTTDSVSKKRFDRAERQCDLFWNYVDKTCNAWDAFDTSLAEEIRRFTEDFKKAKIEVLLGASRHARRTTGRLYDHSPTQHDARIT